MRHSTSIGIDAHAKTNSVCALVHDTGEVREARLSSDPAELVAWIRAQRLPEPLRHLSHLVAAALHGHGLHPHQEGVDQGPPPLGEGRPDGPAGRQLRPGEAGRRGGAP